MGWGVRQAGRISIVGVYAGFTNKFNIGAAHSSLRSCLIRAETQPTVFSATHSQTCSFLRTMLSVYYAYVQLCLARGERF